MEFDVGKAQKYKENFFDPFSTVARPYVKKITVKPLSRLDSSEERGRIFNTRHYLFDDMLVTMENKKLRKQLEDIISNLDVYQGNYGWGSLPIASILSSNPKYLKQEMDVADLFFTLATVAKLGISDGKDSVNTLDFFSIYQPPSSNPSKKLLERPTDLRQFVVLPEVQVR